MKRAKTELRPGPYMDRMRLLNKLGPSLLSSARQQRVTIARSLVMTATYA